MNRPRALPVAALVVLGSLGALGYSVWRNRPVQHVREARRADPAPSAVHSSTPSDPGAVRFDIELGPETAGVAAQSMLAGIDASSLRPVVPQAARDAFANDAKAALQAYLSTDSDRILGYFAEYGVLSPVSKGDSPELAAAELRALVGSLKGAQVSPNNVRVRPRMLRGVAVDPDEEMEGSSRRDWGRPFLQQLPAEDTHKYEVVFHANIHAGRPKSDQRYAVRLGLTFSWNPIASRWVLSAASIYGQWPEGVLLGPPKV